MSDDKKNGHRITPQTVIAAGTILLTIGGSWFAWGQQTGELKQKVSTLEQRQSEDRKDTKEALNKVDTKVERIDQNVNQILQTIKAMEAVQRAERSKR